MPAKDRASHDATADRGAICGRCAIAWLRHWRKLPGRPGPVERADRVRAVMAFAALGLFIGSAKRRQIRARSVSLDAFAADAGYRGRRRVTYDGKTLAYTSPTWTACSRSLPANGSSSRQQGIGSVRLPPGLVAGRHTPLLHLAGTRPRGSLLDLNRERRAGDRDGGRQ
jgi:hypothetical protein